MQKVLSNLNLLLNRTISIFKRNHQLLQEKDSYQRAKYGLKTTLKTRRSKYTLAAIIDLVCIIMIGLQAIAPAQRLISPLVAPQLTPLTSFKSGYEVMGFAPHWTFDNLDNVDFKTLTTFAYFGLEINSDGSINQDDPGYQTFKSRKATDMFKKAHANGTRVVVTITNMSNSSIRAIMDDPASQATVITQTVAEVKARGVDGINLDFEYSGDPGQEYRDKFTKFTNDLVRHMHKEVPGSRVTVSVYASAIKDPKIYDIAQISKSVDGIFMMAYDFAVASSDNAIPTAPLYGHKEGKYWYDVATAVDDFLKYMPAEKLILGVPYYGYNYRVSQPVVKAQTLPGRGAAQTYTLAQENVNPNMEGVDAYKEGWDDAGKVSYKAYRVASTGQWRMVFIDDAKSLGEKYDFAKGKKLAGVGMWALGFDNGKKELWNLLAEKFGSNVADSSITTRKIYE